MKSIVDLFLEKAPSNVDVEHVKHHILEIDGVEGVHHIHVRSIDGVNNFATLHVVVNKYSHEIKVKIKEMINLLIRIKNPSYRY